MREKLFDIKNDPAEQIPVTSNENKDFKKAFDEFVSVRFNLSAYSKTLPWANKVAPIIDEELRQRLRSLGYLK